MTDNSNNKGAGGILFGNPCGHVRPGQWSRLALAIGCALTAEPACADYAPGDPFYVFAAIDRHYDDNLALLAPGESLSANSGYKSQGDWLTAISAGAHAQYDWSQQHFSADGLAARNSYTDNRQLNYSDWQNALSWNGTLLDKLQAGLTLNDANQRSGAEGIANGQLDDVRDRSATVNMLWTANGWLSFDGSSESLAERHSQLADYNFDQDSVSAGATLNSPSGSSLGLHADSRRVTYLQNLSFFGLNDAYTYDTLRLDGAWQPDSKTSLSARLGHTRIATGNEAAVENLSSTVGSLDAQWRVSGKTRLLAGYARDYDTPGRESSPTLHDIDYLRLENQLSDKLRLSSQIRNERRNLSASGYGIERTRVTQVALTWKPEAAIEISPHVEQVRRRSLQQSDVFDDWQYGISLKVFF